MRLTRLQNPIRSLRAAAACGLIGCAGLLGGCDVPSFLDPGETAGLRANAREPLVVQVLDELDPALEQGNRDFAAAQDPRPDDLVTRPTDYAVGANDLLQITVYDLEGPGLQTIKTTRVSGTGNITLPYLQNVVRAEGLSEIELQQAVADAYRQAGVLDQANVSVSVIEQRNRAYSIMGSVARPGDYVITTEDFRLLNALTQAGDVTSPLIEEIYIFRPVEEARGTTEGTQTTPATAPPAARPGRGGATQPAAPDDLAPPQSRSSNRHWPKPLKKSVMLQAQGQIEANAEAEVIPQDDDPTARVGRIDGQEVVVQPGEEAAAPAARARVNVGAAPAQGEGEMAPPPAGATAEPFAFNEPTAPEMRVIRVPLSRLRNGDLQYNVAIRPRDVIMIPPGLVGFYYMHGHVASPGAYQFSGQKVTITQAIAAARGLDGLAIPQRTDIIRRIGPNQQMMYRVDLAAIFAGKRPDLFLKPDDTVSVGTNFLAPFLAAVRGGFRMTYGFGFLYDRNFAYSSDTYDSQNSNSNGNQNNGGVNTGP